MDEWTWNIWSPNKQIEKIMKCFEYKKYSRPNLQPETLILYLKEKFNCEIKEKQVSTTGFIELLFKFDKYQLELHLSNQNGWYPCSWIYQKGGD